MRGDLKARLGEAGSAFVISILVLFVLSVLGMALMLTTTTETDISVNYRWGEMAFFNADAALEYAKNVLATYALKEGDFRSVLPPPRTSVLVDPKDDWGVALPEAPPCGGDPRSTAGCRDYQYYMDRGPVDASGNYARIYIGRVLTEWSSDRELRYDFRQPDQGIIQGDIDGDGTTDIDGTATVWIRRPVVGSRDSPANDVAVITAEGTAPNWNYAPGSGRPGSLRRLEMTVALGGLGIAGDIHSDVSRASEPKAKIKQAGWKTVVSVR